MQVIVQDHLHQKWAFELHTFSLINITVRTPSFNKLLTTQFNLLNLIPLFKHKFLV